MVQREDIDWAIKVENVSKAFKLPHEKQSSLKGAFLNSFKKKGYEKHQALEDISFEVKKGEFFGIVGRNGSGKSTLLKIISRIYSNDTGKVKVNGSLVPFIELGVGFNPELSGRDNVYLNGAMLGFSRKVMEEMYDEIVEFAELERFMDQKLKNYSSGMQVRLAFSIAIRAESDILILDEVLAVGDDAFKKKCLNFFEEIKSQKRTVILVTHDMGSVVNFCDRAMLLDSGNIVDIGSTADITTEYFKQNINIRNEKSTTKKHSDFKVKSVKIKDASGKDCDELKPDEEYILSLQTVFTHQQATKNIGVGFSIRNTAGVPVAGFNSYFDLTEKERKALSKPGEHRIDFAFKNKIKNGSYHVAVGIHYDKINGTAYHNQPVTIEDNMLDFVVSGWSIPNTLFDIGGRPIFVK